MRWADMAAEGEQWDVRTNGWFIMCTITTVNNLWEVGICIFELEWGVILQEEI